jgi:hypothetical protein
MQSPAGRGSRPALMLVVGAVAAITLVARRRGYMLGTHTVVRCRQGHLFSTIWIPGLKLKALDLGVARLQRCPVGEHWSLVVPVREADLSDEERKLARSRRDVRLP